MKQVMTILILILLAGCGAEDNTTLLSSTGQAGESESQPLRRALAPDLEAEFVVQDDWGTGFTAQVTLTNNGGTEVTDWGVSFLFDRQISSIWNAVATPVEGGYLFFEPLNYNRTISPGQSISFGFVGNPGGLVPPDTIEVFGDGEDAPPPVDPGPAPETPTESGLTALFSVDSDWGSGMTASIKVTNTTDSPVSDWRVEFDLPSEISGIWNAAIVGKIGTRYSVRAVEYNKTLAPGQSVKLGFQSAPGGVVATGLTVYSETISPPSGPDEEDPPMEDEEQQPDPPSSATGYLRTSGADIVDSEGRVVRLTGINWFGMETETFAPHGLWTRSMDSCLDQIAELGYNCLRVPYSNQMLDPQSVPNGIDFSLNPQLRGLSGLEILDALVEGAEQRGMKIILDRHRPSSSSQSELWYTAQYSEERWISDWETLALRYRDNPTVIGFDLHNEPHGPATWGTGHIATDWQLAAQRAGNRILAVNPNLLILVEGVGDGYWWGGNLSKAGTHPVVLSVPNRVVYSPHDYPRSVFAQAWFDDPQYPDNLEALWDRHWGYLVKEDIAPVLLGEFGTRLATPSDRQWLDTMASYIQANDLSFTYWCFNPNSSDTGGILKVDWVSVNQDKQSVLAPLQAPYIP